MDFFPIEKIAENFTSVTAEPNQFAGAKKEWSGTRTKSVVVHKTQHFARAVGKSGPNPMLNCQEFQHTKLSKEIILVDRAQRDSLLIRVLVQSIIGVFLAFFIRHINVTWVYISRRVLVAVFCPKTQNVSQY